MTGQYLTKPELTTRLPKGIPFIIGNEAAERFSFYGMKGILVIFMTKHLVDSSGGAAYMSEESAKTIYHLFTAAAYFFPIIGSLIADILFGKYKTIILLSLGYCVGHACIAIGDVGFGRAIMEPRMWLFIGLIFIAIGAGGIKPCVSAHVGDQFGSKNQHLLSKIFSWFYFSINVGAAASNLLTPYLLKEYGPWLAFGLPGALMALATFVFWLGRNRFAHIPPGGKDKFFGETFSPDGRRALINICPIFLLFIPMFWAIFDQTGSAWVLQADKMDLHLFGVDLLPSQIQAANPILILILIPLFIYAVYPLIGLVFEMTPLRRISIGFFVTVIAFSASALIEEQITGGEVSKLSSISSSEGWTRQGVLDGDADGYGWSSAKVNDVEDEKKQNVFPFDMEIRLRERKSWLISSVEINPYAFVGPPDKSDEAELDRRETMSDEDRQTLEQVVDQPNWARSITVLVRDATTENSEDSDGYHEVGSYELLQKNALQSIVFDPIAATHVKLRINSNWGGDRAKIGQVRVLTGEAQPADSPAHAAQVWPDVAAIGYRPSIIWQILAYILLTAAEVLVSITALEFAYTQAPKTMKSFIMGIYFLGVSLGNLFTAGVNFFIQNEDGTSKLAGADYYWFFTGLMAITAVIFVFYAKFYKGQTFVQGEDEEATTLHAESEAEGIGNT